jgi:methylated-DNA-protein-cysteine methyltransferase-like protein
MTYGQIAGVLGNVLSPKAVGWAMHACPEDVPWHRVVNALGRCSTERRGDVPLGMQQAMLEAEGVEFSLAGALDLERFRHDPLARSGSVGGRKRNAAARTGRRG